MKYLLSNAAVAWAFTWLRWSRDAWKCCNMLVKVLLTTNVLEWYLPRKKKPSWTFETLSKRLVKCTSQKILFVCTSNEWRAEDCIRLLQRNLSWVRRQRSFLPDFKTISSFTLLYWTQQLCLSFLGYRFQRHFLHHFFGRMSPQSQVASSSFGDTSLLAIAFFHRTWMFTHLQSLYHGTEMVWHVVNVVLRLGVVWKDALLVPRAHPHSPFRVLVT